MGGYAVPELEMSARASWTAGAVVNQLVWGLQPVMARWMQVRGGVSAMSLVFVALLTSYGCNMISAAYTAAADGEAKPATHTSSASAQSHDTNSTNKSTASEAKAAAKKLALMVASCYAARSSTNFLSSSLTEAYTVAMIQMLGVFVMASPCSPCRPSA
jgi:hypothetical protein